MEIMHGTSTASKIGFSFDSSSPKYIRKVFNTNPTAVNDNITGDEALQRYWLGESFETNIINDVFANTADVTPVGLVLPLETSALEWGDFRQPVQEAKTGWFIAQDTEDASQFDARTQQKLFRVCSINTGESNARDFKVSIENITSPAKDGVNPYGTFSVVLRKASDSDSALRVVERFSNCNLNPNSADYIGRKIGDMYVEWDNDNRRNRHYGDYQNMSKYVRVEIDPDVSAGYIDPGLLPFGVFGPPRPKQITNSKGQGRLTIKVTGIPVNNGQLDIIDQAGNAMNLVATTSINPGLIESNAGGCGKGGCAKVGVRSGTADNATNRALIARGIFLAIKTHISNGSGTEATITPSYIEGSDEVVILHDPGDITNVNAGVDFTVSGQTAWNTGTTATGFVGDSATNLWTANPTNGNWVGSIHGGVGKFITGSDAPEVALNWPVTRLRLSASDGGLADQTRAYFGLQTTRKKSSTRHDPSYVDHVRAMPVNYSAYNYTATENASSPVEYSWVFTLDDVVVGNTTNKGEVYYSSGSRQASSLHEKSYTAKSGSRELLELGYDRFTSPMFGGFDGVDITEAEPFNNRALASNDEKASYEYASVKRALDAVHDPEVIESNIMAMPGITNASLNTIMIRNCESRADSLAVIDLPDVYKPVHEEKATTFKDRLGDGVQSAVNALNSRGINSSYGCTYYPWVKIYDEINDSQVWAPPSVIALGVFANTENKSALWFAPAGFNRGGLTEGSAGLPVLGITERLSSKDRDILYEANINPIATFPAEGIVVFGQKTLQTTASALDRINVRRMLIFVKKEVSRIANRLLFDQNVQTTWDRFIGQVTPFLERVKIGFGLTEFKVVLDSTTTTPDLIDRNIMYAKIFLKPARSIEFIAVDFIITNTGAAFED
jgi:hypothetical protein